VTTDATGRATVSLLYPRDRVYWLDVNLTIRGQASGTESSYTSLVHLMGLAQITLPRPSARRALTSPYGYRLRAVTLITWMLNA
jgi:hypothetical protein